MAELAEPGAASLVPLDQIIATDYTDADGDNLGYVTFWVGSTSVFSVGQPRSVLADQSENTSPSGCFVDTVSGSRGSLLIIGFATGLMLLAARLTGRFRRAMAGLAVLALCVGFTAGPAEAGEGKKWFVEVSGMYAYQDIDVKHTQEKFAGLVPEVDFNDKSSGFRVGVGYYLSGNLSVKAMVEFIEEFEALKDLAFPAYDNLEILSGSLNAKLAIPILKKVKPYLIAGIGATSAQERISYLQGTTSKTRDMAVSFRGGAGIDVFLTDAVSIGVEGAYTTGIGDVEHIQYTTLSFGLGYHF